MKFSRFLRAKLIPLCCIAFGAIFWCFIAHFAGAHWLLILITALTVLCLTVAWICGEYAYTSARMKKLKRLSREAEGYLLGELIPSPTSSVEEEYYFVMKQISRAAVGKIEDLSRAGEEYRDYVEQWIHEIKTPLTACSLILTNGGDEKKLKTELKRAENLTESILYYARLRTAERDTQIKKISLRETAEEAVTSEMEILLAAGISVEINGDFEAYTDGNAVKFMIKQLLVNAAKYCPHCLVTITAEGGVFTVEDNGAGIAPHELPRIFGRGFVGAAGRKYGGGTGMGLYIVRELCKKLNIALSAQSKEGEYTRFVFEFEGECSENSSNLTKM